MKQFLKAFCILLLTGIPFVGNSQNVCLDFDGQEDHLQSSIPLGNSDFTIELWFRSENPSNDVNNCNPLFHFGQINYNYSIGLCGGILFFYDGFNPLVQLNLVTNNTFNDAQWHYLEFIKDGNNASLYVDCIAEAINIPLTPSSTPNIQSLYLGSYQTIGSWDGQIDEVKVFNYPKLAADICNTQHCPLGGNEQGLFLYYNFDEGTANGNNTSIPFVPDLSSPSYPANFSTTPFGFSLTGNSSNYISSSAQIAYPRAFDFDVLLKDYATQTTVVNSICDGDPLHFGLYQNGLILDNSLSGIDVIWEYKDAGGAWTGLPAIPYSKFSFGIPANIITADCSSNAAGFVDRKYRANVEINNPYGGGVCSQLSKEADLKICCPISPFTVSINPGGDVCDGDVLNLQVCIISPDPYVNTPGPNVDIKWYINNIYDPTYDDMVCFNPTIIASHIDGLCIEARISNCNNKLTTKRKCLNVLARPICGQIDIWPATASYPYLVSPGVYEICPGDDAQLGIVLPSGFKNCIPTWQYSFDPTAATPIWISLGTSNAVQNTNIIPTSLWPSNKIFYRIQCNPIYPACPPCFSNIIEIRIQAQPINTIIAGTAQVCKGSSNSLNVVSPQASQNYSWYCNGALVGNGNVYNYVADKSACYQLGISNACYTILSPSFCVEVCEIEASLSCPLPPNECACLGQAITLDACATSSSCSPSNLQFAWYVDGILQTSTACTFSHTPIASGNTYKVEITDLITGCTGSAERFIKPCNKNN